MRIFNISEVIPIFIDPASPIVISQNCLSSIAFLGKDEKKKLTNNNKKQQTILPERKSWTELSQQELVNENYNTMFPPEGHIKKTTKKPDLNIS